MPKYVNPLTETEAVEFIKTTTEWHLNKKIWHIITYIGIANIFALLGIFGSVYISSKSIAEKVAGESVKSVINAAQKDLVANAQSQATKLNNSISDLYDKIGRTKERQDHYEIKTKEIESDLKSVEKNAKQISSMIDDFEVSKISKVRNLIRILGENPKVDALIDHLDEQNRRIMPTIQGHKITIDSLKNGILAVQRQLEEAMELMPTVFFIEAEDAIRYGMAKDDKIIRQGFTGKGYVNFDKGAGNYIEWAINIKIGGDYLMIFRYAQKPEHRMVEILVNGKTVKKNVRFNSTENWENWRIFSVTIPFEVGNNTIRIKTIDDGPNLDNIIAIRLSST